MSTDVDVFLAHHGIKGMKWGVVKKDSTSDNRTDAEKAAARKKKLIIAGSIAAGVILAAGVTYAAIKYDQKIKLDLNSRLQESHDISWKLKDGLKGDMDLKSLKKRVIDPINPNYGRPGTKNNCMRTTFAYELRRRGMDVRSTVTSGDNVYEQNQFGRHIATRMKGSIPSPLSSEYRKRLDLDTLLGETTVKNLTKAVSETSIVGEKGIQFSGRDLSSSVKSAKTIFDQLGKEPNGARGELGISQLFSGHSMAWEIIKGKPVIIDAQSGKIFDTAEKFASMTQGLSEAGYTRLDNIDLNLDFLERWITNA